ncbi:NAD(P)-dependent oxidoreductase [Micromonospora sp. NPDC005652]|uniref:NAD-dependent epimerase/dehydratase family protein n=1 Tax=Micromonospora sp. NPDC005652 TaxID=3157046 RepID=UPI0034080431
MTSVLVTGAAGTLGQSLVRRLVDAGVEVVGLDLREPSGRPARGPFVPAPFGGPFDATVRSVIAGTTHLVHLAAQMGVATAPPGDRWRALAAPVDELHALVAALPALRHVVFASSYMVYAPPPPDPVTEDAELGPINAYAWSKCAVEAYLECSALPSCRLRFAGVYGPGVPVHQGRAVTEVIRALAQDREVRLYRPGTNLRNHLYVDDAVEALRRAVTESWQGTYNVAGPVAVSLRDIVGMAGEAAGRPARIRWDDGEPGWDAVLDTDRLIRRYGFQAYTAPEDGLRAYYEWAKVHAVGVDR